MLFISSFNENTTVLKSDMMILNRSLEEKNSYDIILGALKLSDNRTGRSSANTTPV